MSNTLIVLAKRPVAGRVKTRLVPPLTHDDAARLAAAALRDTLAAVALTPAAQRVLAFDGDVRGWLPKHWRHVSQPAGDLDIRLGAAFTAVGRGPALLVGMDTPQLRPAQVTAFDPSRYDACLGRAGDGGYWAIGFADASHAAQAIRGVPMSVEHTGEVQLHRLHELGMRVQLLDTLTDVDTITTAYDVAREAPRTAFAAALAAVRITDPVAV